MSSCACCSGGDGGSAATTCSAETTEVDRWKNDPDCTYGEDAVLIENGADLSCVVCDLDLERQYYVIKGDEHFCEECFAEKYHPDEIFHCPFCHAFLGKQEAVQWFPFHPLAPVYPDKKSLWGIPFKCKGPNEVAVHEECIQCSSCALPCELISSNMSVSTSRICAGFKKGAKVTLRDLKACEWNGKVGNIVREWDVKKARLAVKVDQRTLLVKRRNVDLVDPPKINYGAFGTLLVATSPLILCKWCEKILPQGERAAAYLRHLKTCPIEDLRLILQDREIEGNDDDDRDTLIVKVIASERSKEKNTEFCSGNKVVSLVAPGRYFRNRRCHHGGQIAADDVENEGAMRKLISESMLHKIPNKDGSNSIPIVSFFASDAVGEIRVFGSGVSYLVDFWEMHEEMIRADEYGFIPDAYWALAVSGCCDEIGHYGYSRFGLVAYGVVVFYAEMLKKDSQINTPQEVIAYTVKSFQKCISDYGLIEMLHPDNMCCDKEELGRSYWPLERMCDCMQYVAMAAKLGTLDIKDPKCKEMRRCAVCDKCLIRPKVCKRCRKVAYCSTEHQREHWNEHKKQCIKVKTSDTSG